MTFKRSSTRHLLLTIALLGASLAAHALPIESVSVAFDSVTPGPQSSAPGVFSFQFADDGAEFTGLDCASCTVTGIDWQQGPDRLWNSPAQVTLFDAIFSTSGELLSFLVNLRQDETTPLLAPDGNTYRVGNIFEASIAWNGAEGTTGAGGVLLGPVRCRIDVVTGANECAQLPPRGFVSAARTFDRVVVPPEPGTPALLGLGLLAVATARRRRG
ncbi:MAG: PEP-CTERM sorting domain-containing protein [Gammaproteobacteria bacterium]|nr:PEP-CTERM sorting domain-containing protein [Gammaproteobacteria bacterium]